MQKRPQDIRITDLARPSLDDVQKAALAFGESLEIEFTEDYILDTARKRTGLADFGPEDFRERLRVLLNEWGNDDELTGLGRLGLQRHLVRYASNRLLIHDLLSRHPEILDVDIKRPIIVVGLPRTGTTHLLNLMAADRRWRSLPLWESYEPVPMPGEEASADRTDPRYARCAEEWANMQRMAPLLEAMHPMNPDHIHEELELMTPDFASYNFEWLAVSPRWRDYYYATDQTPHYLYMKKVLQILQWQRGPHRWVLKCPQHLEQLPVLRRVFPDATIAVTHRDPVAVIQSAVTMLAYGQRISRRSVGLHELVEYWSDRVEHLLRACVRDRDSFPASQSIDVPFHEFMADEAGMVARVYERASVELTPDARQELAAFAARHPRGKFGRVVYDLQADFGVSPNDLRRRFGFYFDRFGVPAESS
jgi:hypothetical protein